MKHQIKSKPKRRTVECLACSEDIYIGRNPKIGSFVTCDSCDSQFEVIDLEPVMVDWPYYEEDYNDFDELYDNMDDEYEFNQEN